MVLYINGKKAKSLYYNGKKIKEAWRNGVKVFSSEPYAPGTVFVNKQGPATFTQTLEPGVYYIDVTGGGGGGGQLQLKAGDTNTAVLGGSGGCCYGEFYLKTKSTVYLEAGNPGDNVLGAGTEATAGICKINSENFLTASGGVSGDMGNLKGGAGGKATINSLNTVQNINIKAVTGNAGSNYKNNTSTLTTASVSPHGWGGVIVYYAGNNGHSTAEKGNYGGIFLQYIRNSI